MSYQINVNKSLTTDSKTIQSLEFLTMTVWPQSHMAFACC